MKVIIYASCAYVEAHNWTVLYKLNSIAWDTVLKDMNPKQQLRNIIYIYIYIILLLSEELVPIRKVCKCKETRLTTYTSDVVRQRRKLIKLLFKTFTSKRVKEIKE